MDLRITDGLTVVSWVTKRDHPAPWPWTSSLIVEQDLSAALEGWRAQVEFQLTEGATPELVEIRFRPDSPARWHDLPTQRALRDVRLGHVLGDVRHWLNRTDANVTATVLFDELDRIRNGPMLRGARPFRFSPDNNVTAEMWLDAINRNRRPGRGGSQLRFLAVWAQRRVEAETVAPDRPIKWMCERWNETEGAVNALVHRARGKELLEGYKPPTLTPKAEAILRGESPTSENRQTKGKN